MRYKNVYFLEGVHKITANDKIENPSIIYVPERRYLFGLITIKAKYRDWYNPNKIFGLNDLKQRFIVDEKEHKVYSYPSVVVDFACEKVKIVFDTYVEALNAQIALKIHVQDNPTCCPIDFIEFFPGRKSFTIQ